MFHSLVLGCFATSKKYEVMNNQGHRIYYAEERSNCFLRYLCGPSRPFTMTIYDDVGRDVITMHRTLRSSCCWRNCYVQKVSKHCFYMIENVSEFFQKSLNTEQYVATLGLATQNFPEWNMLENYVFVPHTCRVRIIHNTVNIFQAMKITRSLGLSKFSILK